MLLLAGDMPAPRQARARTGRCSRRGAHWSSASSPCSHGLQLRRSLHCCCHRRISTVQIRTAGGPAAAAGCSPPPAHLNGSSRLPVAPPQHLTEPATWPTRTRRRRRTSSRSPTPAAATPGSQDPRTSWPWSPACPAQRRCQAPAPPRGGAIGRPPTWLDLTGRPHQCHHPQSATPPPLPTKQAGIEPRSTRTACPCARGVVVEQYQSAGTLSNKSRSKSACGFLVIRGNGGR